MPENMSEERDDDLPASAPPATEPSVTAPEPQRRPFSLRRAAKLLAILSGVALLSAALGLALIIAHYGSGLPDVRFLRTGYDPPQMSRILAADGTVLATEFVERRTVVPFAEIPDVAKLALLAGEDARFYEHGGLSYPGLLRALWVNLRRGGVVQGASTITQQVAEDVLLGHSRSPEHKVRETLLAFRLERELSKDQLFEIYLNNIYFGHGRYGVEEAARFYFGKHVSELSLPESALLAGIVPSPERFSPRRSPALALARRKHVLQQMAAKGFIAPEAQAAAVNAPLGLAPEPEVESSLAPEAVQIARRQLEEQRRGSRKRGGMTVQTTIDPELQRAARAAVRGALDAHAQRQQLRPPYLASKVKAWGPPARGKPSLARAQVGVVRAVDDARNTLALQVGDELAEVRLAREQRYNPAGLPPSQFTRPGAVLRVRLLEHAAEGSRPARARLELGPQAALCAIDVRTREVRALVGSYEGEPGAFDRSRARRQPGSAFKPFVYGAALDARRVSPASVLDLLRAGPGISALEPPFRISVRSALAWSNNDAAVSLLVQTGPERVVSWAQRLGISSPLGADASLALGAYEVTPLELASAYATFASGGILQEPALLSALSGPGGEPLALPARAAAQRVLDPELAYLVTSMLESVVQSGTGRAARSLGRPIAAKTGTSNDAKDAWFVGYSTELVAAVWVGYDDPLPLGAGESGAVSAGPAFVEFMARAHEGRPITEFPRPDGVLLVQVDPATGLLPRLDQHDAVLEEFLEGMAPSANAPAAAVASIPAYGAAAGQGVMTGQGVMKEQGGNTVQGALQSAPH